jgi:D-alanine--poly(phosphoribitol) ligase subunit 1
MTSACHNLGQLFARAVEQFGSRSALTGENNDLLTYRDLDRLSNKIGRFLLAQGIRLGDRIALSMEKSPTAYALIIAALKIGAPYVALDPRNPPARRDAILDQCTPTLVFTDSQVEPWSAFSDAAIEPSPAITGSSPAYLMFTSGSTGTPKGAVISHANLLGFIEWTQAQYGFTPEDVHTHLNPLYFDNTVFDIYSTFFSGGTLVPFDFATVQDPGKLVRRLRETKSTVWFSVPSLLMYLQVMRLATRENLGRLRHVIFGGEGFPKPKLKQLFDELGPEVELHNVYGPTECTCICSSYRVSAPDFDSLEGLPPLGVLADHFSQHILDGDRPVPVGDVGELCLGGQCVGLGYFNRPDLTAAAFVQNPANRAFREIIYRTGDLVRVNPQDGKLHFIGRRDFQVKHMGYRIELEEIQHALLAIDGVDEAAVLHHLANEVSELVAVVASKQSLNVADIRRELLNRIPKYMVPFKIHAVERLPKNANGKTDRALLVRQFAP